MDESDFRKHRDEWALQIGRFILAFGEIEYVVDQCLVHIPKQNAFHQVCKATFGVRADLARKETEKRLGPHSRRKRLLRALNNATRLANDYRHLIAHGAAHLAVYQDDEGRLDFEWSIMALRNQEKKINYKELFEAVNKAEEQATELYESFRELTDLLDSMP